MELKLDPDQFDEFQQAIIEEIVTTVMTKLVESGLSGEKMEQLTADISFSIASIIDDTTRIETDDADVKPYLAFRSGEDELVHCGENSYTYEFVIGALKKTFDV